jgi:toxin HigB-1
VARTRHADSGPVIQSFVDRGTEDVFAGRATRAARASCPEQLWSVARRKLDYLDSAGTVSDLRQPRGNRLEPLRGDRRGQHSIRVNEQYRICFVWTQRGPAAVEIVDYH